LRELPTHTEWQILERKNGKVFLTDRLELHIIEMEKKPKSNEDKEKVRRKIIKYLKRISTKC